VRAPGRPRGAPRPPRRTPRGGRPPADAPPPPPAPCRVFALAGLLKVLQLSLPGASAGLFVACSQRLGWASPPGLLLGVSGGALGLALLALGRGLVRGGHLETRWGVPAIASAAGAFVVVASWRARAHMGRVVRREEARRSR